VTSARWAARLCALAPDRGGGLSSAIAVRGGAMKVCEKALAQRSVLQFTWSIPSSCTFSVSSRHTFTCWFSGMSRSAAGV